MRTLHQATLILVFASVSGLPVSSLAQLLPADDETLFPQPKMIPVDQATKDPSLVHMRTQLMNALHTCDAKSVLAFANPKVKLGVAWKDFEGNFRDLLAGPKRDRQICEAMYESLRLGGLLRSRNTFESNYVAIQFQGDTNRVYRDGTTYRVITGKNVPVFASPNSGSPVIQKLSYDVVLIRLENSSNKPWQQVEYAKGKFGFVASRYVTDPGGLIVRLHRERTGWRISGLDAFYE